MPTYTGNSTLTTPTGVDTGTSNYFDLSGSQVSDGITIAPGGHLTIDSQMVFTNNIAMDTSINSTTDVLTLNNCYLSHGGQRSTTVNGYPLTGGVTVADFQKITGRINCNGRPTMMYNGTDGVVFGSGGTNRFSIDTNGEGLILGHSAPNAESGPNVAAFWGGLDVGNSDLTGVVFLDGVVGVALPAQWKTSGTIFGGWGGTSTNANQIREIARFFNGTGIQYLARPDFSESDYESATSSNRTGFTIDNGVAAILINPMFPTDSWSLYSQTNDVGMPFGLRNSGSGASNVLVANGLSARLHDSALDSTASDVKFQFPNNLTLSKGAAFDVSPGSLPTFNAVDEQYNTQELERGIFIQRQLETNGATSAGTHSLYAGTLDTPTGDVTANVWSYTHNPSNYEITIPNHTITASSGTDYTFAGTPISLANADEFEYVDDISAPTDANISLGGTTIALGDSQDSTGSTNALYAQVKGHYYNNKFAETFEPTITNGILTTSKSMTLGNAISYGGSALTFDVGGSLTATDEVTSLAASTIAIGGTGFSGVTINGATTGNFGALTNGTNITTSNTATQIVASVNGSSISSIGDLTLTNNLIEGTLSSSGDVSVSASTVTNSMLSGGDINCGGGGIISASLVTANNLNSVVTTTRFGAGNTYEGESGNSMNVNYVAGLTNGTAYSAEDLLGEGYDVAAGDTVTITSTTPIFLETLDAQVEGSLPNVTKRAPIISHDVRLGGEIADIRTRGGYFQIQDSSGTDVLARVDITSSTTLADVTVSKVDSDTDAWVAYYKPATGWGSDRTAYNFTIETIGQLSDNHLVQPIEIAEVLVANAETDPGNALGDDTNNRYHTIGNKLFIRILGTDNRLSSAESQAISLEAANSEAYFDAHVNGTRSTQLFSPGINNGSTWLTATDVQFESAAPGDTQQIVAQVSGGLAGGGLLTPNASGYNEVININDTAASIPQIQTAVAESFAEVNTTLTEVKGNHQVLLTATQRGAVKSATYTAGNLNT